MSTDFPGLPFGRGDTISVDAASLHQADDPVPSRPRTSLTHPAGRYFDHELQCLHARPLGPSWRCTCGERGPIYRTEAEARQGKREHEATHR